ncbi:MAG: 3-keto-disaccharide hydrolase [Burkholderiales bacterium]
MRGRYEMRIHRDQLPAASFPLPARSRRERPWKRVAGSWKLGSIAMLLGVLLLFVGSLAESQQPSTYVPRQSDRPEPVSGDEPGFQPIFDGKTLSGWEGHPTYWRVEDGSLVGEITPATVIKSNTFIIWRGGRPKDFELKLDYRITPTGNSGINYSPALIGLRASRPYRRRSSPFLRCCSRLPVRCTRRRPP